MKQLRFVLLALVGLLLAIGLGRWAQSLFTVAEVVHFSVNFPVNGEVSVDAADAAAQSPQGQANTMPCCDLGGPWARIASDEWQGYPPGGHLTWGEEGEIVVDVGQQGWIKRTLQPNYLTLSSHWIRNVGLQPYRIRLEMALCDYDLVWATHENTWDQTSQTAGRMIYPGATYNMDWYFHLPAASRNNASICEGELRVFDAASGALLTKLPIRIVNSKAGQS